MKFRKFVAVISLAVFSAIGIGAAAVNFLGKAPNDTSADVEPYIGTLAEAYGSSQTEMITREDIYLPEGIDHANLGLYFFNPTTGLFYGADSENLPFDPTKPTVIYSHGMGGNTTTSSRYDWVEKGYNFASFFWGVFADDDPFTVQPKIWGPGGRWKNQANVMIANDVPDKSTVELFAADYYSVLSRYPDYSGFEIHLTGHSLGAQMSLAVLSYFMAAVENGVMDAKYLPDRVTLLDPYLSDVPDETYVTWLGRTVGDGGSGALANVIADKALKMGVAISMYRTSPWVEIACATNNKGALNEDYLTFKSKIFLTASDTAFFQDELGFAGISLRHTYALDWYEDMVTEEMVIYDSAAEGNLEETLSPYNAATYAFARMGTSYDLNLNATTSIADDVSASISEVKPKICGFAFLDANDNGVYDERIASRFSGLIVELYNGETLIAKALTGINGYYSFDVTAGVNYTVKITAPNGYSISQKSGGTEYTANAFAGSNEITVILSGERGLRMLNIALNKIS